MFELRSDGNPVHSRCIRNIADDFAAIGIQNIHLSAMGDVNPSCCIVNHQVIESAVAGNRIPSLNLIVRRALRQQCNKKYHCVSLSGVPEDSGTLKSLITSPRLRLRRQAC